MAEIHKDGEVIVTVSPDFRNAFVSIYSASGNGRNVTYDDVISALNEKGVRYNIDTDRLHKIFEEEIFDRQVRAAVWKAPVDGVDGSIKYFFDTELKLRPKTNERDVADYKDLGYIRNITKGTVIAEITPPTVGEPGMDIRGVELKQIPGREPKYVVGSNTALTEDGLQIVATEDGHLSYTAQGGFSVSTAITINSDIDSSIGNIDFIGDVSVKGEVCENFKISSAKSITVYGNVNGASLEAGGDITVKGGIINSHVVCHGKVNAQFCEYSDITSDGDVEAKNFVVCNVYCGGKLTSSKTLSGGKYTCINDVFAVSAGTPNYSPTEILIGDNAVLNSEKAELTKKSAENAASIGRCTQIIDFLNEKKKQLFRLPEDKEQLLGQTVKTKINLQMEIKRIEKRLKEIDESLAVKQYLSFGCRGTVYPGVKVVIGESVYQVTNEYHRVRFRTGNDGNVEVAPY